MSDPVELSSRSIAPYRTVRDSRGVPEWDARFFTLEGTVHPKREGPGGDGPDPGSSESASCQCSLHVLRSLTDAKCSAEYA
jgi:hypothetical protein